VRIRKITVAADGHWAHILMRRKHAPSDDLGQARLVGGFTLEFMPDGSLHGIEVADPAIVASITQEPTRNILRHFGVRLDLLRPDPYANYHSISREIGIRKKIVDAARRRGRVRLIRRKFGRRYRVVRIIYLNRPFE
jgi:hypothetical protein